MLNLIQHLAITQTTAMFEESIYDKMTRAENIVSDFLKEKGIYWVFESPVFVSDDCGRPRVWSPDFYLPQLGMYIEVACDRQNRSYDYSEKIYKANKIPDIFVEPYDDKYWKKQMIDEIMDIHESRWEKLKRL